MSRNPIRRGVTIRKPPPICPVHGVMMLAQTVLPRVRYCYCPVPGCCQRAKQAREPV